MYPGYAQDRKYLSFSVLKDEEVGQKLLLLSNSNFIIVRFKQYSLNNLNFKTIKLNFKKILLLF